MKIRYVASASAAALQTFHICLIVAINLGDPQNVRTGRDYQLFKKNSAPSSSYLTPISICSDSKATVLLILQPFDWLAAFRLQLLQAIPFIAV
jgi:hypothetical protein